MLRGAVCLPPNRNVPDGLLPAHNQFPTTLNSSFGQLAYQICSCLNGYTQVIWFPDRILAKHRSWSTPRNASRQPSPRMSVLYSGSGASQKVWLRIPCKPSERAATWSESPGTAQNGEPSKA